MSQQKKAAHAVCYQVSEPQPGYMVYAELGHAAAVDGPGAGFDYPRDRGMPSREALESYSSFKLEGVEIIESI